MRPTPARTLSDIRGDLADDSVLKTRVGEEMKADKVNLNLILLLFLLFHNMSTYLSQLPVLPFI